MSRDQADQVALAVDDPRHYKLNSPTQLRLLAEPLSKTFYKNAIASGSIVPPIGESARVRNSDWWTGICVICIVTLGIVAFAAAALIRW